MDATNGPGPARALRSVVGHGNELMRAGFAHVVEDAGFDVVGTAADAPGLIELLEREQVDIVTCEAALPGGTGLAVLEHVLSRPDPVPVIACIDPRERDGLPWGFFQGAISSGDPEELRAALAVVRAGGTYVDPKLRELLKADASDAVTLTSRELQVLKAIAGGQSSREIADELVLSTETVKSHVGNVIRKLDVQTRSEAIAKAFQLGLVHPDPETQSRYRVETQGQYPKYGSVPLCTDLEQVTGAVLRYLYSRVGFSLWMVTKTEGDDWIVLQALDKFYGIKPGSVYRWSDSFCSRMTRDEGPRFAPDSNQVGAYATAPMASQLSIAAYFGVPIEREDGSLFGTLCAIDPSPQPHAAEAELPTVELLARLLGRVL